MTVSKRVFGQLADGTKVHEFRLINEHGMEVSIIEYGASIRDIIVADRNGKKENVSLGFDQLQDYVEKVHILDASPVGMPTGLPMESFPLMGRNSSLPTTMAPIICTEEILDSIRKYGLVHPLKMTWV